MFTLVTVVYVMVQLWDFLNVYNYLKYIFLHEAI